MSLERVNGQVPCLNFQAGEIIYQQGDPASDLLVLGSGSVQLTFRNGHEPIRYTIKPLAMLGEEAFDGRTHSATAAAVTACELLKFPLERLNDFMGDPDLSGLLWDAAIQRGKVSTSLAARVMLEPTSRLMAQFLLKSAHDNRGSLIIKPFVIAQIAPEVGRRRGAANKCIRKFEKAGIIGISGLSARTCRILDPDQLKKIS